MSRLVEFYRRRALLEFTGGAASKDTRMGMGYGRASTPTGVGGEYSAGDDFPYTDGPAELDDDVETEDLWADEASEDVFLKKTGHRSHRNSGNRADRGSLAHSSNRGLGEAQTTSPMTGIYRTAGGSGGDEHKPVSQFNTGANRTKIGSKAGWFGAPPPMVSDVTPPAYRLEDVPSHAERSLEKAQNTHMSLTRDYEQSFLTGEDPDEEEVSETELGW